MSVSGVGSGNSWLSNWTSLNRSMSSLAQAIQKDDLGSAQDAFAKAKALLHSSGVHGHHHHRHAGAKPVATADPNAKTGSADPFATAFGAIDQALRSGDLAGAQSALTDLDSLLQGAARKLTRPPVGGGISPKPPGAAIDLTA